MPYSVNAEAMLIPAAIVTDAKNPVESSVIAEGPSVASAAGQLKVTKADGKV